MNAEPMFETYPQPAGSGKRGANAFDDPAITPKSLLAFDAFAGKSGADTTPPHVTLASIATVAFIGAQFVEPHEQSAVQSGYCRDRIACCFEHHRIASTARRGGNRSRMPCASTAKCRLLPSLSGPFQPGLIASPAGGWPQYRLDTNRSARACLGDSLNIARLSRSQTQSTRQPCKRRQQAMPLRKPNSCGKSSQGIPVFKRTEFYST